MRTLGPFAVPAVDLDVLIGSQSGLAVGVEITNLSGTLLRIQIGSHQEWLPAYRVQRFSMESENSVHIVNAGAEISGAPENQILVVAAYLNDAPDYISAFPGTYPQDISRATTVAISGGAVNATIIGVPSVTISSGNLTAVISGTPNINIQSQSITLQVNHPWVACGTHAVVGVGADGFDTTAVPVDAQQLMIATTTGTGVLLGLSIVGNQTGNRYLLQLTTTTYNWSGVTCIPINGSADSTYHIAWTSALAPPFTFNVYESALPPGFSALGQNPSGVSIPVVIAPDQAIGKAGQQAMALSAPVVLAQEEHDRVFGKNSATFNVGLAAGASLDLVAAVVGQRIYPHVINLNINTAVAAQVQLEDDVGFIAHTWSTTLTVPGVSYDLRGVANLSVGHKMRLHNISGGAAGGCVGSVIYSQF